MICIAGTNPFRSNSMMAQILLMSVQQPSFLRLR